MSCLVAGFHFVGATRRSGGGPMSCLVAGFHFVGATRRSGGGPMSCCTARVEVIVSCHGFRERRNIWTAGSG